jgi:hypothetical protein
LLAQHSLPPNLLRAFCLALPLAAGVLWLFSRRRNGDAILLTLMDLFGNIFAA